MIPEIDTHGQPLTWQQALSQVITCPETLAARLGLPADSFSKHAPFSLKIPETLMGRISKNNLEDPVLKQFLPIDEEFTEIPGYTADPLLENQVNPIPGLLQKFDNRVLLTVTQLCAVHCRFCFRRNFNYADNTPGKSGWAQAYQAIASNAHIQEVILSGGDPLSLSDQYLQWHLNQINAIEHIKAIRLHTRFPVMIPQRITESLLEIFRSSRSPIVMVLHINHVQEINPDVKAICKLLSQAGVKLLNQTVLLRGINDSVEAQQDLAWALFDCGVTPYYLHCFDPVKGAHHFDLPIQEAQKIYQDLRKTLPGYLVPLLVKEIPGEKAKRVMV
jgi:EF-P beta-lysylation protein EpmB